MTPSRLGETMSVIAVLLGAAFGTGLVLIFSGALRRPASEGAGRGWRRVAGRFPAEWNRRRVTVAVVVGVMAGALTRWPVAAVLTTAGLLTLPGLLGPDRAAAVRTERLEALALWTEMLRDTLSAAAGLEQAVLTTADIAPTALRRELTVLSTTVRSGRPLPVALRAFAQEADDPLADVVVAALVMAAERQASQLAALLGELADSVREQVAMRQRIDAGRASIRTGVRVTVTVTLGMAVGLTVLNRPYLDPFNTLTGQLVLAAVGTLFALSFSWLATIGHLHEPTRLLGPSPSEAGSTSGRGR